ncbi:YajQ family cyclic di-GMP-binding protein [Candidatus Albibeggiatoa sp. nov. NOAA]|uniref:YajQ family cyclic di-GMP-binding protein n=1 Tax=Candidatus Albibeggiatoa sp. nov. NOAA TaxID=3162724 RepID=UPI0032FCAB51|nr:YajQ family cyclic di-GMP-binding protein [Thiotrichaceae bacterium]
MPSFDIVSEVNAHEVTNAVDQSNRELATRFDFKGTDAKVEHSDDHLTLFAETDFQLQQIQDILHKKMTKRGIDILSLEAGEPELQHKSAKQVITIKQGVDTNIAKKIVKLIKDTKLKLQASIQGEQVRVTGKKRDDLQQVITMLKEQKLGLPLQFINFRD